MNSQRENTNSKDDFVLKNWFETSVLKISCIRTKINMTKIWYDEFNQLAFKVKNSLHTQHKFLTLKNH